MSWWDTITDFVDGFDLGGVVDTVTDIFDFGGDGGLLSSVPDITSSFDVLDNFDLSNMFSDSDLLNTVSDIGGRIGPLTESGTFFPTDTVSGMLSNLLDMDTSKIFSAGMPLVREGIRGALQERQFDRYLEELQKRDRPYQEYGKRLEEIYDPKQMSILTAREKNRIKKELQPMIDEANYKRLYGLRKRGAPLTKVEQQALNRNLADLYSTMGSEASKNVLEGLDRQAQLAGKQFGLLTEQPSAKFDVSYASYNPYEAALSRLLRG